MVKDVPGESGSEAALEWGVDFDLDDGEEPPTDVEQLTEAQYTVFRMMQILKGTFDGAEAADVQGEKGSGVIVPN